MTAAVTHPELHAAARREGRAWAAALLDTMVAEGRAPAGGWPGTLPEARARVGSFVGAPGRIDRVTVEELARLVYGAARSHWLAHSVREPST